MLNAILTPLLTLTLLPVLSAASPTPPPPTTSAYLTAPVIAVRTAAKASSSVSPAMLAMYSTPAGTAATSVTGSHDADRRWAVQRPNRGLAGRYQDSNVKAVWHGASHYERSTWLCIRRHESMSYTGENPVSTASGAGQWLLSTWTGLKRWVKIGGRFVARQYREAKDAPAWIQDLAFRHVWKRNGMRMWHGTGCPRT